MEKTREPWRSKPRRVTFWSLLAVVVLSVASVTTLSFRLDATRSNEAHVPVNAAEIVQRCSVLSLTPGPPANFSLRKISDRFEAGTPPTLLRNATIWTGRVDGHEVIQGDILLDKGIIKRVGAISESILKSYGDTLVIKEAHGSWVTPGIVDMHSHLGDLSVPLLSGATDAGSLQGLALPWIRSIDGLNTHDDAYELSISGGVTTANILPGSANAIAGQAFTIKLRKTSEGSTSSLLLEPPFNHTGYGVEIGERPRWRQMKYACGENPSNFLSVTRLDTAWAFRQAYETARKIKVSQDAYCDKALAGQWSGLGDFPEELQWEALVDTLRGRVKIHNHCYEAVDLDAMIRLANEFKFPIAAFHHAHETYLVPELLKKAYGTKPAVALFATNARYKRESYRGSEFAPRILSDEGFKVVMKSDHPFQDSRFLLYEAQQAHYYGLPSHLALASVTTTPANVMGYDHRIGYLKEGYDADLVIWDSHPLSLGATPKQVYIDGIAQLKNPYTNQKPSSLQRAPKAPDFTKEAEEAVKWDGLPPLEVKRSTSNVIVFRNVSSVSVKDGYKVQEIFTAASSQALGTIVVEDGKVICAGSPDCGVLIQMDERVRFVDLEGGSISPALTVFGGRLGLDHIEDEESTHDGFVPDILASEPPSILGQGSLVRAVDGLQFESRDALIAYRAGVTSGVTSPSSEGFLSGLSVVFNTGAAHRLEENAVPQEVAALHFSLDSPTPSISTQIAALRNLLFNGAPGDLGEAVKRVTKGEMPLVVEVHSADTIATLITLKAEVEGKVGSTIQFTVAGANEAHLLAKELGQAGIGVILKSSRSFPFFWRRRRILPGPPLTKYNSISWLRKHGVLVGIAVEGQWASRNLRFDVAWAALDSYGGLSQSEAIALASANLEKLLGVKNTNKDLVVTKKGSLLSFEGSVVGIISSMKAGTEWVEI